MFIKLGILGPLKLMHNQPWIIICISNLFYVTGDSQTYPQSLVLYFTIIKFCK